MDLSPEKLFMVAVIALVVLGPQRLPQAARTAGRVLAEARRLSAGVQAELGDALVTPRQVVSDLKSELNGYQGSGRMDATTTTSGTRSSPGAWSEHPASGPVPDDPERN